MLGRMVGRFLVFGLAGWALENALYGERHSRVVPSLPFLPVYGAGGVLLGMTAPVVKAASLPVRFGAYAAVLSALEYAACRWDRADGFTQWDYRADEAPENPVSTDGCIDLKHAAAWGTLGVLME